jgi:hypothetical protein
MMSPKSRASPPRLGRRLGASQPLLALTFAVASLLVPAFADASHVRVLPPSNNAGVALGPRSGLFGSGAELYASSRKAFVTSSAGSTTTSYSVAARTDPTGVLARFGRLGRIDLDFEPTGQPTEQKPGPFCRGGPQTTWEGVFTGTVQLHGRYGFRSIHDRSFTEKGTFTHTPRWVCHLPDEATPPAPQGGNGVLLWAGACDGRGFSVQSERPRAGGMEQRSISYSGDASLRDGRVQIQQDINVPAAPETFSFDEALSAATVSPPAPFHGTGTLAREADGTTTWSGSLSATILGRQVPLAGPGFESELESFPKSPGTSYLFAFSVGCPGRDAVVSTPTASLSSAVQNTAVSSRSRSASISGPPWVEGATRHRRLRLPPRWSGYARGVESII